MCRQPKEAHWLGVRMENFLRAYVHQIERVGVTDVCGYLEGLMRKGQVEWQVKQSLDAIDCPDRQPNIRIRKVPSVVPRGALYGAILLSARCHSLHQFASNGHQIGHIGALEKPNGNPNVVGDSVAISSVLPKE